MDCGNNDKFAKEPDPSGSEKPLPEGFQSWKLIVGRGLCHENSKNN